MATQIKDLDGNVLWQADDFGSYSVDKIQAITDILGKLLSNINIKTSAVIDEDSVSNIYTKEQCDERFVLVSAYQTLVENKVDALVNNGQILGPSSRTELLQYINALYLACYGTNVGSSEKISNNDYNTQISNLTDTVDDAYNIAQKCANFAFGKGSDGSTVDFSYLNEVGKLSDLTGDVLGSSTVVVALNKLDSLLTSLSSKLDTVGNVSDLLGTALGSANLVSAVNKLDSAISTVSANTDTIGKLTDLTDSSATIVASLNKLTSSVSSLNATMRGIQGDISSINDNIEDIQGDISDLSDRVDALESK